jgi:multisubunit Na+/H+ antiporter MnhC subunit
LRIIFILLFLLSTFQGLFLHKGKIGKHAGLFNLQGKSALMFCTGAGNSPGKNFPPLRYESSQGIGILVIRQRILGTEFADLPPEKRLSTTPAKTAASVTTIIPAVVAAVILPAVVFSFSILSIFRTHILILLDLLLFYRFFD